jgi:N-[(2S)-2-amino-2-carboxyethyl]-L-glutamate dehydrogenase
MQKPEAALDVVTGETVRSIVFNSHAAIISLVAELYALRKAGHASNPPSQFLWFPGRDRARLITLSASVSGNVNIAGVKAIASFPRNREIGLPRASATITLHSIDNGFPIACIEGGIVSATRTAASAVLAAKHLTSVRRGLTLAIIGTGLIAKYILDFFRADGWSFSTINLFDMDETQSERFAKRFSASNESVISVFNSPAACISSADIIVFATTAMSPHIFDSSLFRSGQIILHISLRDIGPKIILAAENIVDDVDHCLQAETSPHLAEKLAGNRHFIAGDIVDLLQGGLKLRRDGPVIFSPFGMGILDVGVAHYIHQIAREKRMVTRVEGFVGDVERI